MWAIVDNLLSVKINAVIDKALAGRPCSEGDRRYIYQMALDHYDRYGNVPDLELKGRSEETDGQPSES